MWDVASPAREAVLARTHSVLPPCVQLIIYSMATTPEYVGVCPRVPCFCWAMVAMCARSEVQRGFHVKEEPPTAVSTETRGEDPPSVLFGGVLD